jgi:hypothetical protein
MVSFLDIISKMNPLANLMNTFRNMFKSKQKFGAPEDNISVGAFLQSLLGLMIFIYAIYLAIKCHGRIDIVELLVACCCSPCYIAYRLAVPCAKLV